MTRLTGSTGSTGAHRAAITVVLTALLALAAPAVAAAGIGAGASVQLAPSTIHVGDRGSGTVRISNGNYNTPGAPADAQMTNTVCNAGMACPSAAATDRDGISVTPTCVKVTASTTCVPGYEDPGVLLLDTAAAGQPGSSCAGMTFTVARAVNDSPDTGRYVFTPDGGARVTLPGTGSACVVAFTYTVAKLPKDADPTTTGYETISLAHHTQVSPAISTVINANGLGSSQTITVLPAPPVVGPVTAPVVTPKPVAGPPAPQQQRTSLPTASACTPAPGPSPVGGTLCERGSATITGRTGCAGAPFDVTVRGSQIRRVTLTVDAIAVRTLTKPNRGVRFVQKVDPRRMSARGVHRITARVTFTAASGTRARTLRVTFTRCARRAAKPKFPG
jgi:hypothetical protein